MTVEEIFQKSAEVHQRSFADNAEKIQEAVRLLTSAFKNGKKILIFGNGGSASDSQHMAAEFVGRFQKERRGLPAVALTADTSVLTALSNDYGFDIVFSRQIEALGEEGDIALGISTSGNSSNVVRGVEAARLKGMKIVVLTGQDGGKLRGLADICIAVPSKVTARVQESFLLIEHVICELVENEFSK